MNLKFCFYLDNLARFKGGLNMNFIKIIPSDIEAINKLSKLASAIIKEHYDPILGETQNDYMIDKFQSAQSIAEQLEQGYNYFLVSDNDGNKVGFIAYFPRKKDRKSTRLNSSHVSI